MIGALLTFAALGAFTPPSLQDARLGPVPFGARAAGLVALDVGVSERGTVADVTVVKAVEPFSEGLARDIHGWRFEPAAEDGRAVASRVLVAALVRPAALLFPAPGAPPPPPAGAPEGMPYPESVVVPPYPPNALGDAAVVVEVEVTAEGRAASAHVVGEPGAFDEPALEAAHGWRFRPARRAGADVPARCYLVFVFRAPGTTPGPRVPR
jgi:TonB family protein